MNFCCTEDSWMYNVGNTDYFRIAFPSVSLSLKHVLNNYIISYHCCYFYYWELFISEGCAFIYYFFQNT